MSITCYTCRDLGTKEGCPDCGKKEEITINIDRVSESGNPIPDFYKGKEWRKEKLIIGREDLHRNGENQKFVSFMGQLERFNEIFKTRIPHKSAIISSLPKTSKTTLAFSCMQYALSYTTSISRIINTVEARVMMNKRETLLLDNQLLFVRIPDIYDRWHSDEIIRELLVYRSMQNKPTFFLSDFPVKEVMPKRMHAIIDYRGTEDPLKYPAIIEYFE